MALNTGISYIDWMRYHDKSWTYLQLLNGTEIIDIKNLATPRIKEISRISNSITGTGVGGLDSKVELSLSQNLHPEYTYYNPIDGLPGMKVGIVAIAGLFTNIDYKAYSYDITIYAETGIANLVGGIDYTVIETVTNSYTNHPNSGNVMHYILLSSELLVHRIRVEITFYSLIEPAGVFSVSQTDIGRLWIGNYLEACFDADYNLSYGDGINTRKSMQFQSSMIDESKVIGGHPSWIDFAKTASSGKELLSINNDSYPNGNDVVIVPRIDTATALRDLSIYGILTKPIKLSHVAGQFWDASIDVKQLI